jgi:hypothetical protein
MKQRIYKPFGWRIMFTGWQTFGLGIFAGGSWAALRVNGIELMFGPITISIQPPIPKWLSSGKEYHSG